MNKSPGRGAGVSGFGAIYAGGKAGLQAEQIKSGLVSTAASSGSAYPFINPVFFPQPMKNFLSVPRAYAATLLLLLSVFAVACGGKEGTVEGVNMLYGTDSKVWKTAKEKSSTGEKVVQTDIQEEQRLQIFANGQYTMTAPNQTVSGKYAFDQTAKTITMTPDGGTTANTFMVETLTDNKLTLKSAAGAMLMLEKE